MSKPVFNRHATYPASALDKLKAIARYLARHCAEKDREASKRNQEKGSDNE